MSELQLTGILIKKCDIDRGVSKSGKEYQNRTFVLEQGGQYPKQIAFVLFGDKTSYVDNFNEGDELTVKFSIESRDFNGRYFTNINAYNVQKHNENSISQTTSTTNNYSNAVIKTNEMSIKDQIMERKANEPEIEDCDLPF
jgi:hypothetical protein